MSVNNIDLANLQPSQGFKILGAEPGDASGLSVSTAGDINGDGLDDIVIGAVGASPLGRGSAGESYVIFGKNSTAFGNIDLSNLSNTQGFRILGANPSDQSGYSVSGAGDFDGDGINDIMIGALSASPQNRTHAGENYLIFGKNTTVFSDINLAKLQPSQGFTILGANAYDHSDRSGTGDFNGDGISDILIGAWNASPLNRTKAGESYVIFGKHNTTFDNIDLNYLNNTQGFKILGANPIDWSGWSVSGAGDFNGDGISDIIIGAPSILY